MIKQALLHYSFVSASCIAMIAFFLVFLGAFLWVFRKGSKEIYTYASDIPLNDDQHEVNQYE